MKFPGLTLPPYCGTETKSAEWQEEEQTLLASLRELERAENPGRALGRVRILELANKAHALYVTQTPQEKAKLLRMAIELHRGRRQCLSYLQKALRHDLRTGHRGMVGLGGLEPPTSPYQVIYGAICTVSWSFEKFSVPASTFR